MVRVPLIRMSTIGPLRITEQEIQKRKRYLEITPADETKPAAVTRLTDAPIAETRYTDPRIAWDVTRCYAVRAVGSFVQKPGCPPDAADARSLLGRLGNRTLKLLLEPGRALVGDAGLLLTRVEYLKHGDERNFAVVDAAMNDLLRPALYDAWHEVMPVKAGSGGKPYEIVGPVCETADFLARARPLALREGDLLAIMAAGAYGMSMSSNYNSRPRAAEVMVDGREMHLIRERETVSELMAREILLP